jgi:benzaldehyde dehydrogenase (NAD)
MTLMDEAVWRGKIFSGGWAAGDGGDAPLGASGTGARFGGTANLEAFTDTRWVTIRGDIAPYPF